MAAKELGRKGNGRISSSFDSFLDEHGILQGCEAQAIQQIRSDCIEHQEKGKSPTRLEELMTIVKQVSSGVKRPYVDHGELLYDDHGIPK